MARTAWLLAAVLAPGCGCDLDETEEDLAGEDAKDCGFATPDRTEAAWRCAIDAFERDEPFRISWDGKSADSTLTESLVSDGRHVWMLASDDYNGPRIDGWDCIAPAVSIKERNQYYPSDPFGYEYIVCGSLEPEGNHYQVCGRFGGGSPEPLPFDP